MEFLSLYPEVAPAADDPRWGGQKFKADYSPQPLDSRAAAEARMLARLAEGPCSRGAAITAALTLPSGAGSDELGTATAIWDAICGEAEKLCELERRIGEYKTAEDFSAAVADATKVVPFTIWLSKLEAARGRLEDLVDQAVAITVEP
jgi:hypothetical protein